MQQHLRTVLATAVAAALTGGLLTMAAGPVSAAPSELADDFNGDGYRDPAVGMSEKTINGHKRAGAVLITFGSSAWLTSKRVYVSQNTSGVPGAAETDDFFGSEVRLADFNRNGKADLAVSAPYENPYNNAGSGAIRQLHGTSNGLAANGADVLNPGDYGIAAGSGLGDVLND
ncbi:FG-GAP repeat protein [Streptomyces sp. Wb2n-11]|uniref:FG-GAP repeat protein n=1 Tax=Streptomyces sp. Wb2n-11 TaxID=1030533 RepID=UPI000A979C64|nr:FG-GAP repeat protein [Streptomyces sp. Wb2n-11]